MMLFAKKLAKANVLLPPISARALLHEHMRGRKPARPLTKVHASELTKEDGICPRLYALNDIDDTKPPDQWLSTSQVLTYDIGHMVQEHIAQTFADMGRAIGDWKCVACKKLYPFQQRPTTCSCGSKSFKHQELRFESAVSGASCGVDLLLNLTPKALTPIEIKTIESEAFKELVAPLAEHKLRTNLYLRLISESADPKAKTIDTERALVLYVSKGGFGTKDPTLKSHGINDVFSPMKEWVVKRDDSQTDKLVAMAAIVKKWREGAIDMPHGVCTTALSKRASGCHHKALCFSGKHPPAHDWQEAEA